MGEEGKTYRLNLLGPFRLSRSDGHRINISSKKGIALLAMLATAPEGEKSRAWLQEKLWGSRDPAQANDSFRRELSNLRKQLNSASASLLLCRTDRVQLDLTRIRVDVTEEPVALPDREPAEFLEGLDIREESFEDWLRIQRQAIRHPTSSDQQSPAARNIAFLRRPMLAVLRFANLTHGPENDYLAEGLSEELIEHLSRLRWIPIVSRGASFSHSAEASSIREIGRSLAARYIVDGRLMRDGLGLSIASCMFHAETGHVLWARRKAFPVDATPAQLGEILTEIAGALSNHLDHAEMSRAIAVRSDDDEITHLIWKARWHLNRYTREDAAIAGEILERLLAKEPNLPEALIQFAYFQQREIWVQRGGASQILRLRKLARRAVAADYLDGRGYLLAGIAEIWLRNTAAAVRLLEKAIELNPSLAYAYAQMGSARYLNDQPEQALEMLHHARRLDMGEQYAYYWFGEIAMSNLMLGEWGMAIDAADQSLAHRPAYWYAHLAKIHAATAADEIASATRAARALRAVKPNFDVSYLDWVPFVRSKWPDRIKASYLRANDLASRAGSTRFAR